jgi:hypothetical protein
MQSEFTVVPSEAPAPEEPELVLTRPRSCSSGVATCSTPRRIGNPNPPIFEKSIGEANELKAFQARTDPHLRDLAIVDREAGAQKNLN